MSQASENASRFATRPDATWLGNWIRLAINTYQQARILDPGNEPEHAAILYWQLLEITDRAEKHELAETVAATQAARAWHASQIHQTVEDWR